jgi:hypothetical protein
MLINIDFKIKDWKSSISSLLKLYKNNIALLDVNWSELT